MAFWKFIGTAAQAFPAQAIVAQPGEVYSFGTEGPPAAPQANSESAPLPVASALWASATGPATANDRSDDLSYLPSAYASVNNRLRCTSANLPNWTKALGRSRSGQGDAKLLLAGDSTTTGLGVNGDALTTLPAYSWGGLIGAMGSLNGIPVAPGLGIPPSNLASITDARWTAGTGWAKNNNGWAAAGAWTGNSPAGTLVYADTRVNADKFDVYYLQTGSGGSMTITATGGTPVVQSAAGSSSIQKVTATASAAATTNTLTVSATGNAWIVGVEPYLSTTSKIRVGVAGVGSSTSTHWTTASTTFGSIPCIKTYAPDLTILMLGINDGATSVPVSTYVSNMQQIIAAAAVSGDVMLMTVVLSDPVAAPAAAANEPLYNAAVLGMTQYPILDLSTRIGSYSSWNTRGMYFDSVHPNKIGYGDIASFVIPALAGA